MGAGGAVCAHHADRRAHAVCMECRKAVCQECATEWEGINFCAACLARRGIATASEQRLVGKIALAVVSALLLLAMTRLLVWAGVLVAGMR